MVPVERVEGTAKAGKEASLKKRLSYFIKHARDMEKVCMFHCIPDRPSYRPVVPVLDRLPQVSHSDHLSLSLSLCVSLRQPSWCVPCPETSTVSRPRSLC